MIVRNMNSSQLFSQIILIYLPAMVANMAPIIAHRVGLLPRLNRPINERLLGAHKTVRGVVVGSSAGALTAACMSLATDAFVYESLPRAIAFGAATGFGALVG